MSASSQFHWKGDGTGSKRFIDDAVDVYERVYPNLCVHRADYPSPAALRGVVPGAE